MKKLFTFAILVCLWTYSSAQTWNMSANQSNTITTCSGTLYDAGGVAGNYSNNEITTFTINSGSVGVGVTVTFTSFNLQQDFDYLYIYAGTDKTGAMLATLTGNGIPAPASYTSTNSSITLYMVTSNSITRSGFSATISCDPIPLCTDGIQNGLETGVDCGGCTSCPPCVSVPQISDATSSATADSYLLPCIGGTVNLSAIGQNSLPVLAANFNDGTPGTGWNFIGSGMFNNPCGESSNGTTHLWFGDSSPHPRTLTSNELDVPCGGTICFDLKFSEQGGSGSCEGPDLPNEGVSLMFSTDCGLTFAPIAYFNPDGTVNAYNPMTTTFSTFGPTPFTDWANYCFNIPLEAQTDHTIFRWHQLETSGAGFDHWGLDEIIIDATNCHPYYFDWTHIPGFPDPQNVAASITQTTTFEVLYTNGINDTIVSQVLVEVDELFNTTIVVTDESCVTYANGSADFTGNGSNGNYTFTLSGPNGFHQVYTGSPSAVASNLPAGNYTLITTTSNNCSITDHFTVLPGFSLPTVSITPPSPHLCFNDPSVTLTSVVSGAQGFCSYLWNNGETTPDIQANGGTYSLVVTDQNNCSSPAATVTVNQDALPIVANAGADKNICRRNLTSVSLTGSIQTASGGIWSGGAGIYAASATALNLNYTPSAAELQQGFTDLTLTSTGNNGCPGSTDNVRITYYSFVESIILNTTNITCFGANNGTASISTIGTFSPCTFSWDNAAATASGVKNNLTPGNHTVKLFNSMGCDTTLTFTLTQPTQVSVSVNPANSHLCFGDPNILITSTVAGGTAPYTYSWNTGQATPNLSAGSGVHTLTVRDQNNCGPFTATSIITQNALPIAANAGADINMCRQIVASLPLNGSVQTALGGTWSGGNGTFSPSVNSLNTNYTATAAEINSGFVDLTLTTTGNNNCPAATDVVRINFLSFAESITLTKTDVTCFGLNNGQCTITTAGVFSPATFSWDFGLVTNANTISNLTPGSHWVKIINSMGCDTTLTFSITQPNALVLTMGPANTHLCFGDAPITLSSNVTGGTAPYTYSWNSGQTTSSIVTGPGNFTLTVTDHKGCISATQSATINQDALPIRANAGLDKNTCRKNPGILNVIGTVQTATGGVWSGGTGIYLPSNTSLNMFYTPTAVEINQGFVDLTLTTTGNNGCPAHSDVMRIYFKSFAEQLTLNTTNSTCNGLNNGTATMTTSGIFSPSTFSWDNGPITAVGFKNNLSPGNHQVKIINSMGCDTTLTFNLTQPSPLSVTVSPSNLHLCFGDGPVNISSIVTGGTAPYRYSWNNGAATSSIVSGSGVHILTIIDNNNCPPLSSTSLITQDALPIRANAGSDINICRKSPGVINLHAQVQTALGGIWSGGNGVYAPSNTALNLHYTPTAAEIAHGFVDLTLITTGNNNCPADTDVVRINFLSFKETISLTTNNITCNGYNNGHAIVNTMGTYSPCTYSWNNTTSTTVNNQLSLPPGNHQVKIINSMGCDTTIFFTITEPPKLTAVSDGLVNNMCYGQTNGTAKAIVSGGTPPYQYLWNTMPAQNTDSAFHLPGGNYVCIVTDAKNCTSILAVDIIEPNELKLNFATINPTCHGLSNGTISGNVTGGTPPYQYNWSNGETTNVLNNVGAGSYTLDVTDAHNCTVQRSITILDPPTLVANISADTTICPRTTAQLTVIAIGGVGAYSYTWNPGGMQTSSITVSPTSDQTYHCQMHDANNCTVNLQTHVHLNILEPAEVIASANSTKICSDDSVILSAQYLSSDPSVTLQWLHCPTCPTNEPIIEFPLGDTSYIVEAINSCGTIVHDTIMIDVNPIPFVVLNPAFDTLCPGEFVEFKNTGPNANNWSYNWDFGDSSYSNEMFPTHYYYIPGKYDVFLSIIDDNGCESKNRQQSAILVNPRAEANFETASLVKDLINPIFDFTNKSEGASSYRWDFGDNSTSTNFNIQHEYKEYGSYKVMLIANNDFNCPDSMTQIINITASYGLYAPNSFTPNDDGHNDVFQVTAYGIKEINYNLSIYNRWGEIVFTTNSIEDVWTGLTNQEDKYFKNDIYSWVITFEDVTGQQHKELGHVALVK